MLARAARKYPAFAARLRERDVVVEIRVRDGSQGRVFAFTRGRVSSRIGIRPHPDLAMIFESAEVAVRLMKPRRDYLEFINALKNFQVAVEGPDELSVWFAETLQLMSSAGWLFGTDMGRGVTRFTNNTNGGPVFVYVKDDRILRITPIEFDGHDADPWTITARGARFTPPRKTTVSSHALASKSLIESPDRLLYPMKRVDFDPAGERNLQNRGSSGYERIGWDEALDIVAGEIRRVKSPPGAEGLHGARRGYLEEGGLSVDRLPRFREGLSGQRLAGGPCEPLRHLLGEMERQEATSPSGTRCRAKVAEDSWRDNEVVMLPEARPRLCGLRRRLH